MILPRDRHAGVLLLLLALGTWAYFSLESSTGHVGGLAEMDGYYYYVYLRSLQVDGDLDFSNEYETWGNPFQLGTTATGRARNIFGVGPAILWAPFFLLAHLIALIGVKLGFPLSLDGMSRLHQVLTFYGSLVYGWLAVVMSYRVARSLIAREHALWAALGAALAGPLPYYCLGWSSYSHAQAAFTTALMVWLWVRWRSDWTVRRWILFGASAGLVVLVRPASAPFLLLPLYAGLSALLPAARARDWAALLHRSAGPAAAAAAALLVFSPQMVVWKLLYGQLLVVPQGQTFMVWTESAWPATLFSPRNGLFTTAPLLMVAVLGLIVALRRQPRDAGPLLALFCAVVFVNGAVYDWWGWGFSARRYTACLPLFTVGLAAALRGVREALARAPRRAIAGGTALLVLGAVLFNLQWLVSFTKRNLDWYGIRSTEGLYMTVTHDLFGQVYSTVGNPLSLPSALTFSARRGGTPSLYDRLSGSYLLGEFHPEANPAADPLLHATLDFGDLRFRYNLSDSFGAPQHDHGVRYAPLRRPEAHVFLPINRPGDLQLRIIAQALVPGTKVELTFNGRPMGIQPLPSDQWGYMELTLPDALVERGINRIDLDHRIPPIPPPSRCIGQTGVCASVDIAAISGGKRAGNFAEVWVDERRIIANGRGINVAVVDPRTGAILATRFFDAVLYPAALDELARFFDHFPRGSVVALGLRGDISKHWGPRGPRALARLGATGRCLESGDEGYAAVGVLGAKEGSAVEACASKEHARAHVGRPPPPWRVLARYRAIQLR